MTRRRTLRSPRAAPLAAVATLLAAGTLAACGAAAAVPDRDPDVTGTVEAGQGGAVLVEPSDRYYERMAIVGDDGTLVVGSDGEALDPDDLATGDAVEVWVGEACAESFPVQCDVIAVRVVG